MNKKINYIVTFICVILIIITILLAMNQRADVFYLDNEKQVNELIPENVIIDLNEPQKTKYFFNIVDEDINGKGIFSTRNTLR